jgi:hypothetical protein
MNAFAALAASVVALHLAFVVFATLGGMLALRWPRIAWVHLPAAAWAAFVEFTGGICPLTPLESHLRLRAGLEPYSGDFVAAYIFPVLYPEGLTRNAQVTIGAFVVAINVVAYGFVLWRTKRTAEMGEALDGNRKAD